MLWCRVGEVWVDPYEIKAIVETDDGRSMLRVDGEWLYIDTPVSELMIILNDWINRDCS